MNHNLEVKFKKIHEDAVLPNRSHGNRPALTYEEERVADENVKLQAGNPQAYTEGYRIEFPKELDENGDMTDKLLGTGDTGYDIFSVEDKTIPAKGSATVYTGVDLAYISPGFWFLVAPRSGLGFKNGLQPHLGTIDNPYRGDMGIKLYNFSDEDYHASKGDRIAQLIFFPVVEPNISWSDIKYETERNEDGLGSSGK
jgi:dUTP pyrophosphatase